MLPAKNSTRPGARCALRLVSTVGVPSTIAVPLVARLNGAPLAYTVPPTVTCEGFDVTAVMSTRIRVFIPHAPDELEPLDGADEATLLDETGQAAKQTPGQPPAMQVPVEGGNPP